MVHVDYSQLNKLTIPLCFPMPNIESILDRLAGKSHYSTLDMMMGYHQWLVDESSIPLTAQTGLYEYTRVPFGCMNAPNGFQQIMREILASLDGQICEVYLDDIIIITGINPEFLIKNIETVLQQLNKFQVIVKPSKCKFGMTAIEFLGHVINKDE